MTRDEQALWDGIADEAVKYIDERADERDASDLRIRYADVIGKNNFANRDFESLIDSVFDNFGAIEEEYARSNDRLADFLPKAIADIVDGHFANSVLGNRRTADDLDNRTFREMEDMVKLYKDLLGGRSRGGRDRGRGGRDDRDNRGGTGYSRGGRSDRGDRGRTENLGRTSSGSGGGWRNQRAARTKVAAGDHWAEQARDAAEARETEEVVREESRRPAAAKPIVADSPIHPPVETRPLLEGPDYTKARPHDEFLQDGEHWKVASKSGWKIPFDYNNPLASVPKLYDVRTHIKYHVKNADGKVREEIVKVTQDNRYLAHEGQMQPERYQSENRRNTPAVSLSGPKVTDAGDDLNEVDAKPQVTNLGESLGRLPTDQFNIGENGAPLGETINGLVFNTRMKMYPGKDAQRLNICYRHTAQMVSSWAQEDLVKRIYDSNNLSAAAQALRDLKADFDVALWNELNKRFSDLVLRAVRFQFQHNSVKAMSFANDWEKLIAHLETTKGEGFASDFAQRTSYIIPMACAIAAREDISAFTEQPDADLPAVVFLDYTAVIGLDSTLDLLGVGRQLLEMETGASITQTTDASLSTVVRGLYNKLDEKAPSTGACRVFINTNDGAVLELIPFAARKENFILVAAK
jgi:very-short-patch-repair endonuclease